MQAARTVKSSKQRKTLFQAPDHIRYKHFAALLSPELRKSYGTRSLPVRSGDTVRVMRGERKGFEGKVSRVDRESYRIYVEGLTREKVDGTTIFVPVHPSKVMITKLNLDDKWRKKILERKKRAEGVAEKVVEKHVEEKVAVEELPLPTEEKPKRRKRTAKKPEKKKVEEKQKKKTREKPKKPRKRKKVEESRSG
ncbi:MAG: 50S ribosomal protein L24 [Candidatus Bathyarchaeia archaeon]|jgi:large subunit ribosomal protein L24|nr:50S ribosomal protein L24 [Candidatus Bathyarchaeota archaeon A05DMB-3]